MSDAPAAKRSSAGTAVSVETDRIQRHQDHLLLLLTLLIGAVVGLVIVAFIVVTERLGTWLFPDGGAAWRRLAIPAGGALLGGLLLARFFPGARGSGIPQTKVALFLEQGHITLRTVIGKFTCASLSLASGLALGREGPAVHIGGGIASVFGRRLGLGPRRVRALVPVGTAAALAAAFNTPISAVLFTLEEILDDLHAPVLGSVVISAATSWAVLHLMLGNEPLFHVPAYQLVHPLELAIYAVLGLAGGLVSVAFVRLLLGLRRRVLTWPASTAWIQPAAGGLAVGLIGWFVPDVLGVGYGHVGDALNGRVVLSAMALLLALKVVATAASYASGNAGGIFGPSLFIGAMLGGTVGAIAHGLLPDLTGSPGAYALVGMGTAFAGIIRAPMTSVIMIFEVTRDYAIIVPLMIANLVSYFVSRRLQPEAVYSALLSQQQVHLPPARARAEGRTVELMMTVETDTVRSADRVADHAVRGTADGRGAWPVMDGERFLGMLTEAALRDAVRSGALDRPILHLVGAGGPSGAVPHVHPDQTTDIVLHRLARAGVTTLPVVSRANPAELLGTVSLDDLTRFPGDDDDEGEALAGRKDLASPRVLLTAGLVGVVGLLALAGFLTHRYNASRIETAVQHFEAGNEHVRRGRDAEAIERYRAALSLTRNNDYRLALALALAKTGRADEAEMYLRDVLASDPGRTPAHLALARIAAATGRTEEAVASFGRAIEGSWPVGAEGERIETVFELVQLLRRTGSPRLAVAELLQLAERTEDPSVLNRIGEEFIALGSSPEALDVFRQVLRASPRDGRAWQGVGEAELTRGDWRAARTAYERARRLDPASSDVTERLALCERLLALDPTLPGLRSRERLTRSLALLSAAVAAVESCGPPVGEGDQASSLMVTARKVLDSKRLPASPSDAAEDHARLARDLWAGSPEPCKAEPPDEALTRILGRIEG